MKVQPITDPKDIKRIKKLLTTKPRDLLLFVFGINTGLRVQDLLALRIETVAPIASGERITIQEKKTGKQNVLIMNDAMREALDRYLAFHQKRVPHEYLFKSRKYYNEALTTYAVTHYVQNWCDAIHLKGNYGAHTLRKTWAYQQRKQFGVALGSSGKTVEPFKSCSNQTLHGSTGGGGRGGFASYHLTLSAD